MKIFVLTKKQGYSEDFEKYKDSVFSNEIHKIKIFQNENNTW